MTRLEDYAEKIRSEVEKQLREKGHDYRILVLYEHHQPGGGMSLCMRVFDGDRASDELRHLKCKTYWPKRSAQDLLEQDPVLTAVFFVREVTEWHRVQGEA
jgi:hypothetical protein